MTLIPPTLYFLAPEVKIYAVNILKRELFYLKFQPKELEQYVEDYFQSSANDTLATLKWKVMYYLRLSYEDSDRIYTLIKYFLLSSDFFINKMDESKEVRYLGLFNSYLSPVPNPYSFVLYPPPVIGKS